MINGVNTIVPIFLDIFELIDCVVDLVMLFTDVLLLGRNILSSAFIIPNDCADVLPLKNSIKFPEFVVGETLSLF